MSAYYEMLYKNLDLDGFFGTTEAKENGSHRWKDNMKADIKK
jgi:hypothetical protein